MFKSFSIKNLLQLWSLGTIFSIVIMAVVSIYINALFSNNQFETMSKTAAMQGLSGSVSKLATLLASREQKLLISLLQQTTVADVSTQQVEADFKIHWTNLIKAVGNDPTAKSTTDAFWHTYQHYLEIDSGLLAMIARHNTLRYMLTQRMDSIESKQQDTQVLLSSVLKDNVIIEDNVELLYQTIELNVSRMNNHIFRVQKREVLGNTANDSKSRIQTYSTLLSKQLVSLGNELKNRPGAATKIGKIEDNINGIRHAAVSGYRSLYHLQQHLITVESELIVQQQLSMTSLNDLVSKFDDLSVLIRDQNWKAAAHALDIAQNTRWLMIGLAILIALSMAKFVFSISGRINGPLEELRSAMHALSSRAFDTRLNQTTANNEFSSLAGDFNRFAEDNQHLIEKLDKATESLQEQKQHLTTILNGVPEAVISLSNEGIIESTNPSAEHVLRASESDLLGQNFVRFFAEDHQISSLDDIVQNQKEGKEFSGLDYHGQPFSMWLSLNPITSQDDLRWVCVVSDITARKQAERKLTTTSSELDTILENAMVGIAFIKDRRFLRVNQKFEDIFGYSKDEIVDKDTRYLCATDAVYEQLESETYNKLDAGETFEGEMLFAKDNGDVFWCGLSCKAISADDPEQGTIWLFEDVTAQRENEEALRKLASLDSLTGLPNRSVFNDRLSHAIHQAHRGAKRLAIFFLDLDHFKHINDSLGHKAGDLLLCEVAKRLRSCVREVDTVARLGGDEFTVILEDVQSVQYVAKVAEKVLASVVRSYMLGTTEVNISPSIGVSLYPSDGRDVDVLLKNADAAMYHAKNNGRNNFQFYSAEMNAQAAQRLEMETSLRKAVEQQDFYLHFQPQVDLETNKIMGAEALLRWHSEQWGEVSPVDFIPILEDTGLIGSVGEMVLKEACKAYMSLQDKLDPNFKIAVNLSGRQFKGAPLATFIRRVLKETGMSATNLELEITESILMEDTELAIRTLSELSALGITLAVDDFGTGYSSLSYLKQFPLNVLKIDKSFIDEVSQDNDDAAIVEAILAMSGHLKLDVVAEGIETLGQLNFLQARHCHRGQGYYFSKPLDFQAFESLVVGGAIVASSV